MNDRLHSLAVAGVVALLMACGQGSSRQDGKHFQTRLDAGAECAELFEIRNAADPDSATVERMNGQLREVGCYSSSSARSDQIAKRETPVKGASRTAFAESYTMREYRIYRAMIDAPMSLSEDESLRMVASDYDLSADEVKRISDRVQRILFSNGWFSTPEAELRRATDWDGSGS